MALENFKIHFRRHSSGKRSKLLSRKAKKDKAYKDKANDKPKRGAKASAAQQKRQESNESEVAFALDMMRRVHPDPHVALDALGSVQDFFDDCFECITSFEPPEPPTSPLSPETVDRELRRILETVSKEERAHLRRLLTMIRTPIYKMLNQMLLHPNKRIVLRAFKVVSACLNYERAPRTKSDEQGRRRRRTADIVAAGCSCML